MILKRVLEVFGEPISRGGQESYVMTALQHMDLSELHIDLFTPYYCDNQEYIKFIEDNNGRVEAGNMPFVVGGTRREVIPVFEKYLHDNKYDVVHIHSGSISILAYYARVASKNGVKKVMVHSHSSGEKENIKHFLIKIYAAGLFKKYATDFCACSMEAAKWKFPKSALDRVRILNNGVDLEKFKYDLEKREKIRLYYGISIKTLVWGHVGRFTYEKNQIFLVEMLSKYLNRYESRDVVLILVGDGPEQENVKEKAKELGVIDNIIFTGAKDDVNAYLQAFDVFLFPSLYEGLGIVGIEAQASGLPVIASTGVPATMKITEEVHFLELKNIDSWIDKLNSMNYERHPNEGYLKKAGFDILDTSRELLNIYG